MRRFATFSLLHLKSIPWSFPIVPLCTILDGLVPLLTFGTAHTMTAIWAVQIWQKTQIDPEAAFKSLKYR